MITLQEYIDTGFTPEQINRMYESLLITNDLIIRLICGDFLSINQAVDDALLWLDGFASYSKEMIN